LTLVVCLLVAWFVLWYLRLVAGTLVDDYIHAGRWNSRTNVEGWWLERMTGCFCRLDARLVVGGCRLGAGRLVVGWLLWCLLIVYPCRLLERMTER